MKKFLKICLVCLLVAIGLCAGFAIFKSPIIENGEPVNLSNYQEAQDIISLHNLNIDAVVGKDNVIKVTETFDVTFNSYGLTEVVRLIPYATKVKRLDNNGKEKESLLFARITNIKGTGDQVSSCNLYQDEVSGYLTIGLKADSYVPVGTTRSYTISYDYDMGKDTNESFDDVYFNLVGVNSLLTIRGVTFRVTLPTDYSQTQDVKFYVGGYGDEEELTYGWDNNVLTGACDKLGPLEGITFRVVYEDGFLEYKEVVSPFAIVALVVGIITFVGSILVLIFFKQTKKIIEPVELIVPDGLTPLKAEYYTTKDCTVKGIIGSLIVLAKKGYLKINEREDNEIEIIKLQDIKDTEDYGLRALFKGMFSLGRELILVSELEKDSAFADAQIIVCNHARANTEKSLYHKNSKKIVSKLKILEAFLVSLFVIMMVLTTRAYFGFFAGAIMVSNFVMCIICIVGIVVMFICKTWKSSLIISLIFIYLMVCYYISAFNVFDGYYLVLVATILIAIALVIMVIEDKYSKTGAVKKGRALGFKKFIKMCEVEQIKAFADKNPSLYFDVLPYAYVFGLADAWIKKFESIKTTPPEWITVKGGSLTDMIIFHHTFNSFSRATQKASQKMLYTRMKASVSSGNGSFGGGGGFSGGGGGFSGGGGGGGGFGAR